MASVPHSQNPHLLTREEKTVSRAELFRNEQDEPVTHSIEAEQLLNDLLANSLEYDLRPKKRRKVEVEDEDEQQEPLLFRLVSSTLPPIPISLEPPPPRPDLCKELPSEDNEDEAEERARKAQEIAVDGDWVIRASGQRFQKILRDPGEHQVEGLVSPSPPVMIVSTLQPRRRTRPSVPKSSDPISNYPYKADGPLPTEEDDLKVKCCPVASTTAEQPKRKSRRRRKAERERPPPTFWRPNPALAGKCRGYAYGYPSSFAAVEDWDARGVSYCRDTMRRIQMDN